jgi:hypothetical protein
MYMPANLSPATADSTMKDVVLGNMLASLSHVCLGIVIAAPGGAVDAALPACPRTTVNASETVIYATVD